MSRDAHPHHEFHLADRARAKMREEGFEPDFSGDAAAQVRVTLPAPEQTELRDLRTLLWSSIDNRESRDLDQIEVAEAQPDGSIVVRVGIADVDALVPASSSVDLHAARNCCSVYTGVAIFPLLPEALSTDRTSLVADEDRQVVVIEMRIDAQGDVTKSSLYRALARNHAKLSYEEVGEWLDGRAGTPAGVERVRGMAEQLHLQNEAATRLQQRRRAEGALEFDSVEARPVVDSGRVVDLVVPQKGPARRLIEQFMIAANMTMARVLEERSVGSIQRVVRSPQRWPRICDIAARFGVRLPPNPDPKALGAFLAERRAADPERFPDLSLSIVKLMGPGEYALVRSEQERTGHFGLAAYSYTHSTAPNRRFADLVVQRGLKHSLAGARPAYTDTHLAEIAARCTERENAARKVERFMRKAIAAVWLSEKIGETFDAIVTGASTKGTYVRVVRPPVEGRVVQHEQGLDVGDHVRVRLIATDPERGFIDFAAAGN